MNKVGRPPKNEVLTPAERARRYREKKKAEAVEPPSAELKRIEIELLDARQTIEAMRLSLASLQDRCKMLETQREEANALIASLNTRLIGAQTDAAKAEEQAKDWMQICETQDDRIRHILTTNSDSELRAAFMKHDYHL